MKLKKLLSFLLAMILCLGLMSGISRADAAEFSITVDNCGCYGMYCFAYYICDKDRSGSLSSDEFKAITRFSMIEVFDELHDTQNIMLKAEDFTNLSFLRRFPNLEQVWIFAGETMDLSGLKKLKVVYDQSTTLKSLNVNGCKALEDLNTANNTSLTSLDLGNTGALTCMYVHGCTKLKSLNLGNQPNLIQLTCHNTPITELDLSGCRELDAAVRYGDRTLWESSLEIALGKRNLSVNKDLKLTLAAQVYNPFTDVPRDKYYYESVMWAYYHDPQITGGTTATTFGPGKECTRAQIMTFLWKANGAPEPYSSECPFTDVPQDKYYYKAVLWAVENKITGGVGGGKFGVNKACTREQVVTFLWKAAGAPEPQSTSCAFTDVDPNKYYYKAVLWAVENKITGGVGGGKFGVGKTCTRAQIATFLYAAYGPKG